MADKKFKLEAVPEAPPELAPAIAKKINESGVAEGTKKKLLTMMGKPETEGKLLKESAAKDAAEDLKKFKEKVLDKPSEIVAVEAIREDVHGKILAALGTEFTAGADKYKFEELEKYKTAFKKPDAPAPAPNPAPAPDAEDGENAIRTADRSVYTSGQVLRAGALGVGALGVGTVGTGLANVAFGNSAVPMASRFTMGAGNFLGGARDILWNKTGLSALWTNAIATPLTTLAGKLGISTGAGANTAALAGFPSWVGPGLAGAAVVGGAYAGSRVLNWAGRKIGVKPSVIPVIGRIPVIGPILNSFLTVPPKAAWKGLGKGYELGKTGVNFLLGKGEAMLKRRNAALRFGLGAAAGAGILAALTGGSSLIWGRIGGEAARKGLKGKSWTDFIPAPLGIKKSGGDGHGGH